MRSDTTLRRQFESTVRFARFARVDEDTPRRASRLDQSEATWRHAVFEQALSFAERVAQAFKRR
jgi:hypothetical protein